jgi:SAM-dependent methyltransferase
VSRLDDPEVLRREYETEERFLRRSVYDAAIYEGPDPREHALVALFEARPQRVLDAGCGTGEFAERVARVLGVEVVGVDQSERMVELARTRGLEAQVADVRRLPFEDGEVDAASANWMLYHVADSDRGLGELARVLRPGGRLVAITNSVRHLEEIWGVDVALGFSAENGARALERHFTRVERRDVVGAATFVTRENLRGYLAAFERLHGRDETDRLAALDVPLRVTCRNAVFVADKAP